MMESNVVPLLVSEDLVQDATDLIRDSDICGNDYFKIVFQISDEAADQLVHVLEHRNIIGSKDEDGNRKVLVN